MKTMTDTDTTPQLTPNTQKEMLEYVAHALERVTDVAMQMAGGIGCANDEGRTFGDACREDELLEWITRLGDAHWRLSFVHWRLKGGHDA